MVRFLLHRPIAVLITTLALLVLGIVTFRQIPVSLLPDIAIPEITVQVGYPNASARELQQSIVKPLRNQLQQVGHMADLTAETRDGLASLKLRFDYGTDIDLAYIETNEKIDGIIGNLPRDLPRPKVIKAGAADIPVFNLNVTTRQPPPPPKGEPENSSPLRGGVGGGVSTPLPDGEGPGVGFLPLSEFCENVLKRRIEQLPEVALVDMSGLSRPEAVILPDQARLLSLGITAQQLGKILEQNNIELGNLLVKDGQYQYNIRFASVLKTPADIENVYFKIPETDRVLQVKDVARVQIRERKLRGLYTHNQDRAVVMSIIKQSDTQLLQLKDELNRLIRDFQADYPDLQFSVTQDQTELLDVSISNLVSNLIIGGLCAFAIIFLFLGDLKAPVLIGLTIPVSLVITFLFFYLLGISINIISLAGLVLGIGMVVDSAIIVIENIEQFRADGHKLDDACIAGTNEVMMPLFTSILTNSAVFLPLVFLSGIAGALFFDQAVSVSLALGISLLSSFTLIPVLYRLFYRKQEAMTGYVAKKESLLMRLAEKVYGRIMHTVFRYKAALLVFFAALLGLAGILFFSIDKQGMPTISRTELQARVDWNEPLTVRENEKRLNAILKQLGKPGSVSNAFVGQQQFLLNRELQQDFNEATVYLKLDDQAEFERASENLRRIFKQSHPDALLEISAAKNVFEQLFQTDDAPLQARLTSNRENQTPDVAAAQAVSGKFASMGLNTEPPALQRRMHISILNEKLLLYEVEYERLLSVLKTMFNENNLGNLKAEQQAIPIMMGGREETIRQLIDEATVTNSKGQPVPVKSLIQVSSQPDYKALFSGREGDFIPFDFQVPNDQVVATQNSISETVRTQPGLAVSFSGAYFRNLGFIRELGLVILVSVALLFFILSAQFESLVQPLIVMIAVVFGLTGSLLLLYLSGSSLNVMSAIGMVVMIGIVDNDSILKIDTMNRGRDTLSLMDSITLAGKRRLKAQLMTSATTILGLVPTLFSSGLGNELQKPLALAVIGGMLLGTFISITFIPLVYWFLYRKQTDKVLQ